jgi:hypothetical protein
VAATTASTVLVIAATVMTLPLTLATIASGTRQSRGGMGVVGVECLWGRRGFVEAECEFLQDQAIPDLVKG